MVSETRDVVRGYVEATLAVARAEDVVDRVENELRDVAETAHGSAELREFFSNPAVGGGGKRAALEQMLGGKVHAIVLAVLGLLVEQGHGRLLSEVVELFVQEAAQVRGSLTAEVTTAVELDEAQQQKLRDALVRRTGRQVVLRMTVDPALVGGAVVRVGDQIMDGSVRSRIDRLRVALARV